uniref:WGS project CAEQ00000000 data, annotated contig 18 n=1 Tax=Trypanosoma congolense (strain IL3000) TaxID=1068625 RepID=F9W936_TRYCI|nr:unnamed protein product [Trypanosoma congolense IL3000]
MRRSSAFFAATRLSRESIRSAAKTKGSVSTGKELRNGFDRLILAPVSESGKSQTVWKAVAGRPCRLRACWCDARVDIVPYANVLHYHCKYEQLTNDLGYEMEPSRKFITRGSRPSGRHDSRVSVKSSDRRKAMTPWQGSSNTGYPGNRTTYQGCKGTSHQCESIGFYGKPRPDKRSVVFFSDQHPMLARGLRE